MRRIVSGYEATCLVWGWSGLGYALETIFPNVRCPGNVKSIEIYARSVFNDAVLAYPSGPGYRIAGGRAG